MKAVMMGAQAIQAVMLKLYCWRNGKHEFDSALHAQREPNLVLYYG
jgi:hypothetical protein